MGSIRTIDFDSEQDFDWGQRERRGDDHILVTQDGRKVYISRMSPGHLENATNFLRKRLAEIDGLVREYAQKLVNDPTKGSQVTNELTDLAMQQQELEDRIEILITEEDRRKLAQDRSRRIRGESVLPPETPKE